MDSEQENGDDGTRRPLSSEPLSSDQGADADAPQPCVLFLSGDLMFASRVRGAAERAGLAFQLAASLPEQAAEEIRYVVLDLSTRSSLISTIVAESQAKCPQAMLVAYGPHVQVSRLSAARQAGIPRVLTRGQFDQMLGQMFELDPYPNR